MKNQYFGDINDYRKYGLLRILGPRAGLSTAVCWMLTPDDGQSDGKFTQYLDKPAVWSSRDPELFHELKKIVRTDGVRDVRAIESTRLLPGTRFYSEIVPKVAHERRQYMSDCLNIVSGSDLAFFDPDNGMEVKSAGSRNKPSPKHLYWPEVAAAFAAGHSLLIYQHFQRVKRQKFISGLVDNFRKCLSVDSVTSFSTANVVFFLVTQSRHRGALQRSSQLVSQTWGKEITVAVHDRG